MLPAVQRGCAGYCHPVSHDIIDELPKLLQSYQAVVADGSAKLDEVVFVERNLDASCFDESQGFPQPSYTRLGLDHTTGLERTIESLPSKSKMNMKYPIGIRLK